MRVKGSYIWAGTIALVVVGWMLSDEILPKHELDDFPIENISKENKEKDKELKSKLTVSAIRVQNEITPLKIRASGVTRSKFEINVVARRQGNIQDILVNYDIAASKERHTLSKKKSFSCKGN